ncbi:MAG: hypothetical protein AAF737_03775 [Pseudomonadota bacterium]
MTSVVRHVNMDKAERVVAGVTRRLPLPMLDALGGSMGRFASRKTRRPRRDDMDVVLPHLFPRLDRRSIERLIDRNWSYIGRSMLRIGNLPKIVRQVPTDIRGFDQIIEMSADNQPYILAFVHLGLWELLVLQTAQIGRPPLAIYQAPASKVRTEIALQTRSEAYLERYAQYHRVSSEDEAERQRQVARDIMLEGSRRATGSVLKALHNGGSAWFAADECVNGHIHGPWFGKLDRRSGNISVVARLAAKTGAAIVPCWSIETGDGYQLNFEPSFVSNDVDELMDRLSAVLSPKIEAHYEQWFMLHELRPADFGLTGR